jgi:hypothetical protein
MNPAMMKWREIAGNPAFDSTDQVIVQSCDSFLT